MNYFHSVFYESIIELEEIHFNKTSVKLAEVLKFIHKHFEGNSDGHDAAHTIRVYKNALKILQGTHKVNKNFVIMGALLHDVDDHKLFKTENNYNARKFMKSQGIDDEEIECIVEIINGVSFSKNKGKKPANIETAIVQDADRLDAIGAIGIARAFAFGGSVGNTLDDTIQHFHEKLLTLKNLMNTPMGKKIARERHDVMIEFLKNFDHDIR